MVNRCVRIVDTTLRDGMHSVSHKFTPAEMATIAAAIDDAGVDTIEVSHGDGLGGSSIQYGRSNASDQEYLCAVAPVLKHSKLAILIIPGVGIQEDLRMAAGEGVKVARVATHVTEADIAEQHISLAKKLELEAVGFLMMSHLATVERMVHNAKLMENFGADCVYVVDSAGNMLPNEVRERVLALRHGLKCHVGFHAHNNLGLAVGNTLAAIEAGAHLVDGSLRSMGAGGGNTPTETLVAVLNRAKINSRIDLYKIMDAANLLDVYKTAQKYGPDAVLMLGYAGVYSSFLLHAAKAADRFNLSAREVLVELGRLGVVGGQEDMIIDVAYELANRATNS